MNPFYDLNKRLAGIGKQEQITESAKPQAEVKSPARLTLEESLKQDMKTVMEDASGGAAQSNTLEGKTKSYSAKKAAAGKDIGKPGKNFAKIAKDAGQRYGSKAAGERVAGAVLNKLRHAEESATPAKGTDVADKAWLKTAGKKPGPLSNVAAGLKAFVQGKPEPMDEESMAVPYNAGTGEPDAHNGMTFEAVSRKHFQQVADLLQHIADPEKRKELALHHAHIFKQQNPRFDINRFAQACGVDLSECAMWEELKGGQKKLDKNKNGKLDANDFAMLRGEKSVDESAQDVQYAVVSPDGDVIGIYDSVEEAEFEAECYGDQCFIAQVSETDLDEGWPTPDQFRSMYSDPKDTTRSGRHDVKKISTGTVYTRKFKDEPEGEEGEASAEPKRRGRPKGKAKGPERVTANSYKYKAGRPAKNESEEELDEKSVSQAQAHMMAGAAHNPKFAKKVGVSQKVAKEFNKADTGKDISKLPKKVKKTDEEATVTRDNRAEKAGKKVTKDLEYDMGHKGKDDNKAEKAGKKVAKDIEYDEKKKKVKETTTSGSVATVAQETTKGGVYGKGIYDSINREIEAMIAESFSMKTESITQECGDSQETITITASGDELARIKDALASMGIAQPAAPCDSEEVAVQGLPGTIEFELGEDDMEEGNAFTAKLAQTKQGDKFELDGKEYKDTSNLDEADVTVDENDPDYPTNKEYSDDALQYSGGLNKPKTTVAGNGQTTVPFTAVQPVHEVAEDRSFLSLVKAIIVK